MDPQVFEQIANNTLAVLGSAANRRSEWRNNLVEVRNGMTARGNRNMTALRDAGGNPAGLGQGLKGVYARTWQTVVEHLLR